MKKLIDKIKTAKKIVLSTHRTPDGDGLGSELALFHFLKEQNYDVRLIHVDKPAFKYNFITKKAPIEIFQPTTSLDADLVLIFDTNDGRMIPGLWDKIVEGKIDFSFIDHHPLLNEAPDTGIYSFVDTKAASTGEIAYKLIKELGGVFNENIAEAIYTSICFDTQLFRYIKSSAISHQIAAEMIPFLTDPEYIHDNLFGNIPIEKFKFISHCTNKIQFLFNDQLAYLEIMDEDLIRFNMSNEDTRDLTDQILGIDSVELAIVVIPTTEGKRLSFRSKKPIEVLDIAKQFGGGGHRFASGAFVAKEHPLFAELKKHLFSMAEKVL